MRHFGILYTRLQLEISFDIERDAFRHLQQLPYTHELLADPAYLTNRVNNDTNYLAMFYLNVLHQMVVNVVKLVFPALLIWKFNAVLGISFVLLNLLYFGVYLLFKKPLQKTNEVLAEEVSRCFSEEYLQLADIKFLQTHGLGLSFLLRLGEKFKKVLKAGLSARHLSLLFSSADGVLHLVANVLLFMLGGRAVMAGLLSIGRFTMILTFFNMMMEATKYFFSLGEDVQEVQVFRERMAEIFSAPTLICGRQVLESLDSIHMEDFSFGYAADKKILSELSYRFTKGTIVGLSGENGSGKSTFIQALLGLHVNGQNGRLDYNGMTVQDLDMNDIRKNWVAVCEQEPSLLPLSLRENLCLGHPEITDEEIVQVLEKFALMEFVSALPDGLETKIKDDSFNVSGGQKQRLALARAFLRKANVLFLDEPGSAMDSTMKAAFLSFLQESKEDKIIFISTHDAEFLAICDQVLRFATATL